MNTRLMTVSARLTILVAWMLCPLAAQGRSRIFADNVKTLQVVVNQNWMSMPVMRLRAGDVLNVGFDELSHNVHRYRYRLEHCEADWSPSEEIFESDWLEGFNDNTIDDYENSLNTTVMYTHYWLQLPNDRCRLKMSGNYRLHIYDEDEGDESDVICAEFMVTEELASLSISATTNTDVDVNVSHQQIGMSLSYNGLAVTNPDEQIYTVVMQNCREDNSKLNPQPNYITDKGLRWEHNRQLIFEAGNEYHKFEVLDVSHPTMGIDQISWDGHNFHAYPFTNEPRRNYIYDEDADGAFYIRNSDNVENDRISDYVYVHYKLCPARHYPMAHIVVDGHWTTEDAANYRMEYDEGDHSYNAVILQKQGYYSYQYVMVDADGAATHCVPEEGSFSQTENQYQALIYYKGTGARTWRLVAYQQVTLK